MISSSGTKRNKEKPLVSIIVVTYNSEEFVVETLDSAKAQTYSNIELIITDDCSTDSTIEICSAWLKENGNRFERTHIETSKKNTGVAPNINRGIRAATGEWVKLIAGDDLLFADCVDKCLQYASTNEFKVISTKRVKFYNNNINDKNNFEEYFPFSDMKTNWEQQYQLSLRGKGAPLNTWFIRSDFIRDLHFFDEEYPMMEDWPIKFKVLKSGNKIGFLDDYTVYYRIHDNMISQRTNAKICSDWRINTLLPVKKKYILPEVSVFEKLLIYYDSFVSGMFYYSFLNRKTRLGEISFKLLQFPVKAGERVVYSKLKNRIHKQLNSIK